jgi:hypothetical protein
MHKHFTWWILTATLLWTAGCASVRPGTGDLSFRLRWSGDADLDLHVMDPRGYHTGMLLPPLTQSKQQFEDFVQLQKATEAAQQSGVPLGILDVDCNAGPDRICRQPIENVFWPVGTAPRGDYAVWVEHFQSWADKSAVPFVVEVRRGETVVQTFRGTVAPTSPKSAVFPIAYGSLMDR